ncbi:MAG: EAL domain-containing protein [Ruminococcus sp.]|nr:EAL domain-containing protein [Ruminococcus sp.]
MKKVMIFLSAFFAVICILLTVIAPDFLSMMIIILMDAAIALGFVFGLLPCLRYSQGFKEGQKSIDSALEINADSIWTAVSNVTPFFKQKNLDDLFESYLNNVKEQKDNGVIVSDIEDSINEETIAIHSWRGVVLQIAGILTALGLLGTFLGLVTGISSVAFSSAEATIESIETLLRGIATAFYTSIVGVILSILFNVAYRLIWNVMLRDAEMFMQDFHNRIQPTSDEQIRTKQYLNAEKMIETLNVLRTNSSMNISRSSTDPAQEQRMMIDILSGLRHGEFTFLLEPVVNLSDRTVIKAQSKLQWNHGVLGPVQPSVYMPIVESDGFIAKLDQHLWEDICKTLRDWIDRGLHPIPVILSIRKTDLLAIDVYYAIRDLMDTYDLEPRYIEVAIEESAYVICHDEAAKAEKEFIDNGFKVTINNFSGNLVNLGEIAADEICLDLSAPEEETDIESIFSQAAKARLKLTCEKITSAKMLADIKRYGCLEGRGEHLYPDMTQDEFEKLMNYR